MGKLFDVLALLADQGPDCLSWNKEVDNLLLLSLLLTENRAKRKISFTTPLNSTISGGREIKKKTFKTALKTFNLTCQILEEQLKMKALFEGFFFGYTSCADWV